MGTKNITHWLKCIFVDEKGKQSLRSQFLYPMNSDSLKDIILICGAPCYYWKLFPLFSCFSLPKKENKRNENIYLILKEEQNCIKSQCCKNWTWKSKSLPPNLNFSGLETHLWVNSDQLPKGNKTPDLYFQSSFSLFT